ncbi:MAG: hypothetical protein ACYCXT_07815 [Acidiferrobacteraceae bacterium]
MSTAVRIAELEQQNAQLSEQLESLKRQLDGFKRQLFGAKSEKQRFIDPAVQGNLLATLEVATPSPPPSTPTTTVTYTRKKRRDHAVTDCGLRFDATVPVNTIVIGDPAIEALPESARECIGEKVTYRLAQRPASYEVLKYVRRVYKILATEAIVTTVSPPTVLEKCVADVSLLGLAAHRQVPLPPAPLPSAPAYDRSRHPGEPWESDPLVGSGDRSAGADLRRPVRACVAEPRARDGRNTDQGGTPELKEGRPPTPP